MTVENDFCADLLRAALTEREETLKQLDRDRAVIIQEIANLTQGIAALSPTAPAALPLEDTTPDSEQTFWDGGHKDSYTRIITDGILTILALQRPLHRKEIARRLEAKGIILGGRDPVRTLSPYLSNDRRFVTAEQGRGLWTLAAEPPKEICTVVAGKTEEAYKGGLILDGKGV